MAEVVVNKITGDVIEGYDQKDLSLIPAFEATSQFTPSTDNVEFSIYNEQGLLEYINYNYKKYQVTLNYSNQNNSVSTVTVNPEKDLLSNGYDQGNYTVYYNFIRNVLNSSQSSPYFLSQISSDRTEIRIINNSLSNEEIKSLVDSFTTELNDSPYFEDFRLNFSNNNIFIANNILLDATNESQYTVLIKLYEPLPTHIGLKDSLTVGLQTADEFSFRVEFENKVIPLSSSKKIKGPNFNLSLPKRGNNDSSYKNGSELLLGVSLSSSLDQIENILNKKGIETNINYNNFNNFVYFSSAEQRVRNFFYKVGLIEGYKDEIDVLDTLGTSQVSSSIAVLENKRKDIIKNLDGYEYYQYYSSGSSDIYPKTNTTPPYILASTGSAQVTTWFNTQITSASNYDIESVDRLANSLPDYVQDDSKNASFLLFMDMIGQHFDTIWAYTKDISNRFDGDNRLAYGISKNIVKDALVSMGINIYGNNQSDFDIYSALTQINEDGTTGLISGSGEINTSTTDIADPEPKEDIIQGVYKRIFHNLPYLLKKKGSHQGLRALINTFGIPGGMLRINELGGWDNNNGNSNEYQYYEQVDNLAFTKGRIRVDGLNAKSGQPFGGSLARILFRFKYQSSSNLPANNTSYTLGNCGGDMALTYTGGGNTGSYSGASVSSSLNLYKASLVVGSGTVTAPFLNGEWWSVYIENGGVLKVGSKDHNAGDGFEPVYYLAGSGNATVSGANTFLYGDAAGTGENDNVFAFQELRYYADDLSTAQIKDYIMNPYSLGTSTGNVIEEVYDQLFFRAPLGSDNVPLVPSTAYTSIHPRFKGAYPGFQADSFNAGNRYVTLPQTPAMEGNKEFIYFNEPQVGVKNRVSRKIYETTIPMVSGDTLSNLTSIDQRNLNSTSTPPAPAIDYLEVAFSPQNEINDDIGATFGTNFNINNIIGDPSLFNPNSKDRYNNTYPKLFQTASNYFEKYSEPYNWHDYIRLIKYFDSSLFKMIKEFAPAKSNVATGVVVKQHLLERNKAIVTSGSIENLTYSGSVNTYWEWTNTTHSVAKTLPIGNFEGGTGGVFDAVNSLQYYLSGSTFDAHGNLNGGFKPYPPDGNTTTPFVSQSWQSITPSPEGNIIETNSTQQEFYNGELNGTQIVVTDGDLLDSKLRESSTDNGFSDNWGGVMSANRFILGITQSPGNFQVSFGQAENYEVVEVAFNTSNGTTDYANQLSTLLVGNGITIQTIGTYSSLLSFIVNSISITESGTGTTYRLGLTQQSQLSGAWYLGCQALVADPTDPLKTWDGVNGVTITFDPGLDISRTTEENSKPLYNNVNSNRTSTIFMDVDYIFATGSLIPSNLDNILNKSAAAAPIQDSNYSIKSWTNPRYNGVKNSSPGFNVPFIQK